MAETTTATTNADERPEPRRNIGISKEDGRDWVRPQRSGRERGIWVYISERVLELALGEAGIDPAASLEIRRYPTRDKCGRGQVILRIRVERPEPPPTPPPVVAADGG